MLDLSATELTDSERDRLRHPATGGVILFSRNYQSPEQIHQLAAEIHLLRSPPLLVAVDQEGGRVQRFREGFVQLPPAAWFGALYDKNPKQALKVTQQAGWLMASELRALEIDFSFAPVLDLARGVSTVIGDRAFHAQPHAVAELAFAWMRGAHEAGMPVVGKHFPGHGSVIEDSHLHLPVDPRRPEDIIMEDLLPFKRMIEYGIEAIMPAHIIYEKASPDLAGFSTYWLRDILRSRLDFQGVIFSDDLSMAAADRAGSYPQRARAALEAGCDMILICNNPAGAVEVLEELTNFRDPIRQSRLLRMHGRKSLDKNRLHMDPRWRAAIEAISLYDKHPSLDLDL